MGLKCKEILKKSKYLIKHPYSIFLYRLSAFIAFVLGLFYLLVQIYDRFNPTPSPPIIIPKTVSWVSIDNDIEAILETITLYDSVEKKDIPRRDEGRLSKIRFIKKTQMAKHKNIWKNYRKIPELSEADKADKEKWFMVVKAHDRIATRIHGPGHVKSIFEQATKTIAENNGFKHELPLSLIIFSKGQYMTVPKGSKFNINVPFLITNQEVDINNQVAFIDLMNDKRVQKYLSQSGIDYKELGGKYAVPSFHEFKRESYTTHKSNRRLRELTSGESNPKIIFDTLLRTIKDDNTHALEVHN